MSSHIFSELWGLFTWVFLPLVMEHSSWGLFCACKPWGQGDTTVHIKNKVGLSAMLSQLNLSLQRKKL